MSERKVLSQIIMLAIAFLLVGTSLHAFSKDDYVRLMTTNECRGCDLTRIDLSGANLINADLEK